MTHEERAAQIADKYLDWPHDLNPPSRNDLARDIQQACIEASNAELERRRAVDWCEQVGHFNRLMGAYIASRPSIPTGDVQNLRFNLMTEEFQEFVGAWCSSDLVGIADALADLIYVAIGCAQAYGIPLAAVFAEVHRSNLAKLGPDGKPVIRADGKIVKPEGWQKPDIARILREASCDR